MLFWGGCYWFSGQPLFFYFVAKHLYSCALGISNCSLSVCLISCRRGEHAEQARRFPRGRSKNAPTKSGLTAQSKMWPGDPHPSRLRRAPFPDGEGGARQRWTRRALAGPTCRVLINLKHPVGQRWEKSTYSRDIIMKLKKITIASCVWL